MPESYLNANLAILRAVNPKFASKIESADHLSCEGITAIEKQDREFNEKLKTNVKTEVNHPSLKVLVLAGLGTGKHLLTIVKEAPKDLWLCVCDPHLPAVKYAFGQTDLTSFLTRGRIMIFTSDNQGDLIRWLEDIVTSIEHLDNYKVEFIYYPVMQKHHVKFFKDLQQNTSKAVHDRRIMFNTLVAYGERFDKMIIKNIPAMSKSHRIKDFRGILKGVPAVLVGGGPSLDECLPHFEKVKDKACVITVNRSYKALHGIDFAPEFLVNIDPFPTQAALLDGLNIPEKTSFVYWPDGNAKVQKMWKNKDRMITMNHNSGIGKWIQSFIDDFGTIGHGSTVMHYALYLADYLGCSPIVFTGIDLSYKKLKTGNMQYHSASASQTNLCSMAEEKRYKQDRITLPSTSGGEVESQECMRAYVTRFEMDIQRLNLNVINTSRDGALIRGTKYLSFEKAIAEYIEPVKDTINIDRTISETFTKYKPNVEKRDINMLYDAIEDQINVLSSMAVRAESALKKLSQLSRKDPNNKLDTREYLRLHGYINSVIIDLIKSDATQIINRTHARFLADASKAAVKLNESSRIKDIQERNLACSRADIERMRHALEGFVHASTTIKNLLQGQLDEARQKA